MSERLIFASDVDNVITQTDKVIRALILQECGLDIPREAMVNFDYHKNHARCGGQITKAQWDEVHCLYAETANILSVDPIEGAVEGLHKLSEKFDLHLITTRLKKARAGTVMWLENHLPNLKYSLHFVQHHKKQDTFRDGTLWAAVDDDYDQAVWYSEWYQSCFLFDQPWNQGKPHIRRVERVLGWAELVDRAMQE